MHYSTWTFRLHIYRTVHRPIASDKSAGLVFFFLYFFLFLYKFVRITFVTVQKFLMSMFSGNIQLDYQRKRKRYARFTPFCNHLFYTILFQIVYYIHIIICTYNVIYVWMEIGTIQFSRRDNIKRISLYTRIMMIIINFVRIDYPLIRNIQISNIFIYLFLNLYVPETFHNNNNNHMYNNNK